MQNFLGLNIADNPWALIQSGWSTQHYLLILAAVLIPVLAWGTQVLNMKLVQTASNTSNGTPSQMEATMKTMNMFMPLMTAFICFTFPVGIGIYWIIGAVIRSVQQIIINRHLNNMDMDDFIKKNKAKMDKKKAKLGVTSQNISQQAKMNVRNIEEPKRATIADMDDFIKKNKAKMDKKKAKLGVTSQNISQQAKMNVRNIEEPKRATIADKSNSVKNTASYTAEVPKTKPGSLASKANMVAQFDANNKGKKK